MTNISENKNEQKYQIAIRRRSDLNHLPQELQDHSRICLNCNRSINTEINELTRDPECLWLNVEKQKINSSCIFCNQLQDLRKYSIKCKVNVFIIKNIYIPESIHCCFRHLDINGFIPRILLQDLRFINRFYRLSGLQLLYFLQGLHQSVRIDESNFNDKRSFSEDKFICHVSKKHLLTFLCKTYLA